MCLSFSPTLTSTDISVINQAASRWESIIIGDLQDLNVGVGNVPSVDCEFVPDFKDGIVDDIDVCITISSTRPGFGAVSGVLASAGPVWFTSDTSRAVWGLMWIDQADVNNLRNDLDAYYDVIVHEFGHILGIGTLWENTGLTDSDSCTSYDAGTKAAAFYEQISGCAPGEKLIPVEGNCGHWSESCFKNELMTPTLTSGTRTKLSSLTVASLEDLGYEVSYNSVDEFTSDDIDADCRCSNRRSLRGETRNANRHQRKLEIISAEKAMAIAHGEEMLQDEGTQDQWIMPFINVMYLDADGNLDDVMVFNPDATEMIKSLSQNP
mmetsp:Transcript_3697/g.5434  ORF Transcript_3697/g.5434 Transcript_3697/m.5434 type:complete len:323 (-) Transcript_3697:29-997(-)